MSGPLATGIDLGCRKSSAGLVVFRLLWGLLGTRHARFAAFVRGPKAIGRYLGSMLHGRPEHHAGHNPAGALAIVLLLGLALAVAASGYGVYNELTGEWLAKAHEVIAKLMLGVVGVHVAGVVVGSLLHRENLVRAMLTGRKHGRPDEGIREAWRKVAAVMLVAVLGFWWLQWQGSPVDSGGTGQAPIAAGSKGHDRDHE